MKVKLFSGVPIEFDEEREFNFDETSVTGERGRPLTNAQKQQIARDRQQQQQQQQQPQQQQQQQQQQKQQQPQQQQQQQQNKRPQQQQQKQFINKQKGVDSMMRRKQLYFGENPNPPSWQNISPNQQQGYFPPQRRKTPQQGPGPNDRIMYNQGPKINLPNGGLLRGRPLPAVRVPSLPNSRRDIIQENILPPQPPIPLSRPRPYPSFSNYPVPEKVQSLDPQTLHQLSTTSQLEVTTAPTRHYTHFDRLDAVTINKQVFITSFLLHLSSKSSK